ncbi:MAG: hypothetical protein K2X48_17570 [Chitinophagaceae bacterium]|nr:hypothetical protein [Chitinophagaceae bacterium]
MKQYASGTVHTVVCTCGFAVTNNSKGDYLFVYKSGKGVLKMWMSANGVVSGTNVNTQFVFVNTLLRLLQKK